MIGCLERRNGTFLSMKTIITYVQIKTCNEQVTTVVGLRKKYWFGFDVSWLDHTKLGWGTENEVVLEESRNTDDQMWKQVKCQEDDRYFKLEKKNSKISF
jgi:hypothetical protein